MSKLKRSRALRRNLRKQARKGTLSAREQKTLLSQEKKFRKARRPLMKGLGFGAGLGAGAAAFLGAGGIAQALAQGLISRRQAEDMMNEQGEKEDDGRRPDIVGGAETMGPPAEGDARLDPYADPEGMGATRATSRRGGRGEVDEFEDPEGMGATRATGPTENPLDEEGRNLNPNLNRGYDIPVQDVVVVGEEEEGEDAAEERQATPEDQARAERAAQRAERAREAGVDAALEAGLGGAESPGGDLEEAERQAALVDTPDPVQWNYISPVFREMYPGEPRVATGGSRDEMTRRIGNIYGAKDALRPEEGIGLGGFTDYTGGFESLPAEEPMEAIRRRPAASIPMDRPDPRMGSTLDPRLPGAIDRARRSPLFMQKGGRVDKSNDLVARIKRKYGLR